MMTGKTFNKLYGCFRFVILTGETSEKTIVHDKYNTIQYMFNPIVLSEENGSCFIDMDQIYKWTSPSVTVENYFNEKLCWVREVVIPNDTMVWVEINKFRANKLLLSDRHEIDYFDNIIESSCGTKYLSLNFIATVDSLDINTMIKNQMYEQSKYISSKTLRKAHKRDVRRKFTRNQKKISKFF
jgi:hypothetical protein